MKISVVRVNSSPRKKKVLQRVGIILGFILLVWTAIYLFPVSERPVKPFFEREGDRPLVIAHQGGEHLAPSNTMVAFEMARDMGVDVIEFDIHKTKDGHLVAIHDNTVDRTTDGTGRVNDLTLEEIKALDAADYFQDLNGEYSFRGQGITIPTVEEIFEEFSDMKMVIEVKKTNDPELYMSMTENLWSLIQEYGLEDQILIASFDQNINDKFTEISNGRLAVSGGRQEVTKFVIFHKLFLNSLYRPKVDAVQIPTEESIFNLKDSNLLRGAARRGMEVHYWTINDEETMRELIELGADGIITDRPDLMLKILDEQ
ncbi:glycerophosphoryl diester phosphodiesterase [Evansella vedderi]|uniref:Glycerophosphoryl diester phosphodiesterase n=1 Tax=Evansella vedderi TaxID=38282 RepID=A0ABT9ZUH4_9BACI|nr:glycerophosphodiester phosphodiesterase [Evansella vedderi]MDQ0254869.1 glycerophosphoryl diester phosphodiesterase [Evansella vedderi]